MQATRSAGFNKENTKETLPKETLVEAKTESSHPSGLTGDALTAFQALKKILVGKEKAPSTARVLSKQTAENCNSATELLLIAAKSASKLLPIEMKAVDTLAEHLKKIEKTGKTASGQIQLLNQKIATLTSASNTTLEQSAAADAEKKRLEAELKTTSAEVAKLQAENTQLKDEKRDHGSQLATEAAAAQVAKAEVATLKADLRERDAKIKEQMEEQKKQAERAEKLDNLRKDEILLLNEKNAALLSESSKKDLALKKAAADVEEWKKLAEGESVPALKAEIARLQRLLENEKDKKTDVLNETMNSTTSHALNTSTMYAVTGAMRREIPKGAGAAASLDQSMAVDQSFLNRTINSEKKQAGTRLQRNLKGLFGEAWMKGLEKFTDILVSIKVPGVAPLFEKFHFEYVLASIDAVCRKEQIKTLDILQRLLQKAEFKKLSTVINPTHFVDCDIKIKQSSTKTKRDFLVFVCDAYKYGYLQDSSSIFVAQLEKLKVTEENEMRRRSSELSSATTDEQKAMKFS